MDSLLTGLGVYFMAFKVKSRPRSPCQPLRDSQEHILSNVPGINLLPHRQKAHRHIRFKTRLNKCG